MITKTDLMDYPEAYDINWYLVSKEGFLMFFSSSGGIIPKMILENYESLDTLNEFFEVIEGVVISDLNPFLHKSKKFDSNQDLENYLKYYNGWSSRGLYTFDKSKENFPDDTNYHLVSYPQKALRIDTLPKNIQDMLFNFRLDLYIHNIQTLDWSIYLEKA